MENRELPRSGDLYRHFKGMMYQVIGVAKHSETMELLVVYQALYGDYSMYVRPLGMFLSEVDHEKYPDVQARYRFTYVERESLDHTKPVFPATPVKAEAASKEPSNGGTPDEHPEASLVNTDLVAFLDAKDYAEKLEVLYSIRKRIDERLMGDIELSLDLIPGTGSVEERLLVVRDNLQTMAKFESRRLR